MAAWNQAAGQMTSTTGIAADVEQLAASYQVGVPVQMYRPTMPLAGYCALTAFTFVGLVMACTGMIGTLIALLAPRLVSFFGVSIIWGPLFIAAFGFVLLSLAALGWRSQLRGSKAYECTERFLEVDKDGAVKAAVRWDQMQVLWHRIGVTSSGLIGASGSRNTYLQDTYSVGMANGVEINVEYARLWKRIEGEFVRRHFLQALALFNAGQRVPFNSVSVSQQGVSKETLYRPGSTSMISLQNLAHVKIRSMELCFEVGELFYRQRCYESLFPRRRMCACWRRC